MAERKQVGAGITGGPPNNAMKLTKPIQVRAPRHSASLHGLRAAAHVSSAMRASQLIAVLYALPEASTWPRA